METRTIHSIEKKKIIVNYRVEKVINDGKIHFDCEIQIHDFES